MSKPKLTIPERVDILLREGVDNPKKWMKVHGYVEPEVGSGDDFWEAEWHRLRAHHLDETNCLFDIIRELTHRIKT